MRSYILERVIAAGCEEPMNQPPFTVDLRKRVRSLLIVDREKKEKKKKNVLGESNPAKNSQPPYDEMRNIRRGSPLAREHISETELSRPRAHRPGHLLVPTTVQPGIYPGARTYLLHIWTSTYETRTRLQKTKQQGDARWFVLLPLVLFFERAENRRIKRKQVIELKRYHWLDSSLRAVISIPRPIFEVGYVFGEATDHRKWDRISFEGEISIAHIVFFGDKVAR
ncbi:hypothetical protein V1478_017279 [Vespula squamosa]|uniref:Uncharacterized protein n=1 Tax=Vespula squamosa TaxID=30214 RepID=A0ABD1ZXJ2_VESSQ